MTKIEVCVGSLEDAKTAEMAGADRIELNSALSLDGITPSAGLLKLVSSQVRIPIITMARPRSGDFCYTESEWETLLADAIWSLENGADGIAFGCLDVDRNIDVERCKEMRRIARSHELVFHKAFDETPDWSLALDQLIDAGINRVMTSGHAPTAQEGIPEIAQLFERAAGRIELLPAGKVSSLNAVQIVKETGVDQLHGSFSSGQEANFVTEIEGVIQALATQ